MGAGNVVACTQVPANVLTEVECEFAAKKADQELRKRRRDLQWEMDERAAKSRVSSGSGSVDTSLTPTPTPCKPILAALQIQQRKNVDAALTKWLVCDGIPLHVTDSRYFKEFVREVQKAPGYCTPTRKTVSTTLLANLKSEVQERLKPFEKRAVATGKINFCTLLLY